MKNPCITVNSFITWILGFDMEKNKFAVILPVIVGGLVNKIINEVDICEEEAFDKLYNSALYSVLEREETKVWYYSVPKLFALWDNEIKTGKLIIPVH